MHSHDASGLPVSPDTLKLRLLASLIEAAAADEGDARYEALHERYEEVCEHILARPVQSWSDVAEIAEIAIFLPLRATTANSSPSTARAMMIASPPN